MSPGAIVAIVTALLEEYGPGLVRQALEEVGAGAVAPSVSVLHAVLGALLPFVGRATLTKHIDPWEAARAAADASEDVKFGPVQS